MCDLSPERVTRGRRLLVAWLLAAHALLVLHCSVEDFATYDEIGNLTAGLAYWQQGAYHLYSVNPPLTKLVAALPVLLARPDTTAIVADDVPGARPEWDIGDRFARANAERYHGFVVLARLAGIGWSLLGACVVYRWASALWGAGGGLLSLAVWCFEPNIIAHAHLITPDMPATVAAVGATYAYRRQLLSPSWTNAYIAGVVLGIAQLCKFTLVVLYPAWVFLWVLFALRRPPSRSETPSTSFQTPDARESGSCAAAARGTTVRLGSQVAQLAFLFGVCLFTINLGYEFAGSGKRLGDYRFVSQTFGGATEQAGSAAFPRNRFRERWLGRIRVPLPEDYLRGIDVQRRDFEIYRSRYSYLRGQWRVGGWWHYYVYAATVKVPLGILGLLLLALMWPRVCRRHNFRQPWLGEWLMLSLPALGVLALASSQRSLQNHFRYVLPMFPLVIVFLGSFGTEWVAARRWQKGLVLALLAWALASYLTVHPHSVAYFNELAGGPHGGHNHLLGSNIDWGQDLFRLRRWLGQHPEARPVQIAYFNHIDPRVIGLEVDLPPHGVTEATPPPTEPRARELGPQPGYYAVSVRFVQGNQAAPPNGRGGYRFAPMHSYSYFQHFQPIAKAGYSIFIYHITLDEANAVRARYGLPPILSDRSHPR